MHNFNIHSLFVLFKRNKKFLINKKFCPIYLIEKIGYKKSLCI